MIPTHMMITLVTLLVTLCIGTVVVQTTAGTLYIWSLGSGALLRRFSKDDAKRNVLRDRDALFCLLSQHGLVAHRKDMKRKKEQTYQRLAALKAQQAQLSVADYLLGIYI